MKQRKYIPRLGHLYSWRTSLNQPAPKAQAEGEDNEVLEAKIEAHSADVEACNADIEDEQGSSALGKQYRGLKIAEEAPDAAL